MKSRQNRPQPRHATLAKLTRALGGSPRGLERLEDRTLLTATPILVTNSADTLDTTAPSYVGSLRWAVDQANAAPGADVIQFNVPGGPSTIHLGSKLRITDAVTIDGTTEPGYANAPLIWLDGGGAGHTDFGLSLEGAGGSTVRGLGFSNFDRAAIDVKSGGNLIGGGAAGQGNVIVNSSADGVVIESGAGNVVRGNLIGADAGGNKAENQRYGVLVTGAADQTRVEGNYVGYNQVAGIGIDATGDVDVVGNYVGLGRQTLNGAQVFVPMGNGAAGIYVTGQFAGRDVYLTGNVVVLSDANGITLDAASGVRVTGNRIGTDPAGNLADGQFGNFGDAVHIDHGSTGNVIGGTAAGAGNVITGSIGDGVRIMDSTDNVVAGNTITQNFGAGVAVGRGSGNAVADGNSIYANYGVAIDLMDFSGTGDGTLWFQGPGFDPATAAPTYVAEPTVTSVKSRGAQTVVRGSFAAVPGQTYVIRVYASAGRYEADFGNGLEYFGEAQTYLGSITVTATGTSARFAGAYNLPAGMTWLTATVTDAAGNTSEVSDAFAPAGTEPIVATTLASSLNPSVIGQNVTFTAHVTIDGADATDGSVLFVDGGTVLGTGTKTANGVWTFSTNSLAVGSHNLQAIYVDTDGLASDQPGTLTQAVTKATSKTTLSTSNPAPVVGNAVTLTAHVDILTGVATPTGTVGFYDGGVRIGTATLAADGSATLSYAFTATGHHAITAAYDGDVNVDTSASAAVDESVAKATTQTTLGASPSSSNLGQSVTFTATVTALDSPLDATGTVTFYDGGTVLGTGTLSGGVATLTTSALAAGDHTITAVYAGSANHLGSQSDPITHAVVVPAPVSVDTTTTLVSSNASPVAGTNVTLTATVTPASGSKVPTGLVHFTAVFADNTTLDLGEAALDASGVAVLGGVVFSHAGAYAVTATYVPADETFAASGASLTENVQKAASTTTVSSSANPATVGVGVTLTAHVTSPLGSLAGGSVSFFDAGTLIGTGTLDAAGNATLNYTFNDPSVHRITASFAGTADVAASTSDEFKQNVNRANTKTTLAASSTTSDGTQAITFTASVSTSDSPLQAGGTVDFYDGSTLLGSGTVSASGLATLTVPGLAKGLHTVTATYRGSGTHQGSASNPVTHTVSVPFVASGHTLRDLTGNGLSADDTAVGGVTVKIFADSNDNGVLDADDAVVSTLVSDASGLFTLSVANAGRYFAQEVTPTGYAQTAPAAGYYTFTAAANGSTASLDFANWQVKASKLSGYVYVDRDNDGVKEAGESGLANVTIMLKDAAGNVVATATTDCNGAYTFTNVMPGTYTLVETQPARYVDGIETAGSLGGDASGDNNTITAIPIGSGQAGTGYNFGELPESFVTCGETATIGFWQNKNGQALIKSFNGGQASKALAGWLANTFPNLYGAGSANSLVGKTNADVATLFTKLFTVSGQKLDAQVLAVALAVYSTTNTLGGTAAAKYGFTVDGIGTGHRLYNIGTNGAAFGVANNTNMEVLDILHAADVRAVNGVLYGGNTGMRNMANNVFTGINEQGDI